MIKRIILGIVVFFVVLLSSFYIWLYPQYEVPILMYHTFDETRLGSYSVVPFDVFREQMEYILRNHYNVMTLDEYCRSLRQDKPIGRHSVVITFDDGHKDNTKAAELLAEFHLPATIFIIVDNIGQYGYLSEDQIKDILKNSPVRIGSHTMSHQYLPDATDGELTYQIHQSKAVLTEKFDFPVSTITYPVGGFDKRALKEAERAGYICGCTTNRGFSREKDLFALRRIKVTHRDRGIKFWSKLTGFYNVFKKPKPPY